MCSQVASPSSAGAPRLRRRRRRTRPSRWSACEDPHGLVPGAGAGHPELEGNRGDRDPEGTAEATSNRITARRRVPSPLVPTRPANMYGAMPRLRLLDWSWIRVLSRSVTRTTVSPRARPAAASAAHAAKHAVRGRNPRWPASRRRRFVGWEVMGWAVGVKGECTRHFPFRLRLVLDSTKVRCGGRPKLGARGVGGAMCRLGVAAFSTGAPDMRALWLRSAPSRTDWPQSRPIGGACGPCRTCVGVGCDWRLAHRLAAEPANRWHLGRVGRALA